ncbi:MAG TPA: PSD1 and planctomycete cytochrome C domain-containing protein, partial [Pirellulales bacterium]|nr:PSD1 and planctomycete cytochrome C domain-containing protein [Pirellulales bacterium]
MSAHRTLRWSVALLILGSLATASPGARARADEPAFDPAALEFVEREVRPLLVERCFKCHGNVEQPKGGLKLVDRAAVLQGGDSGPAAIPGKPAESYLIQAIGYRDATQMPPDGKLSDAEIATLTKWVELGLPWPTGAVATAAMAGGRQSYEISDEQRRFWAFQPVKVVPPAAVAETDWPRGEIDRYILARLEASHLRHAPQADRRTLIRRATFDLTGLPPTPAEVEAFLADTSADAFAKVVDRLLASPHYGERWGRHWLDVARYTDFSDARFLDTPNDMPSSWRYRDWVVAAFNRDLPYDRFVIDQLAGDLIEPATPDRLNVEGTTATGFLAIGAWGNGDADKEKMMSDIVDDQINATSRAFLGLTVSCARCHDHKFDPIPTADYYSLAGIFYSTHILPNVGDKTVLSSILQIPLLSPNQLAAREAGRIRAEELKKQVAALFDEDYQRQAQGLVGQTARYLLAAWDSQDFQQQTAGQSIEQFASQRGLDSRVLSQWITYLGLGEPRLLAKAVENPDGVAGVHAWLLADNVPYPWVQVNPTDQPARNLTWVIPPYSAAVHPSPTGGVAVAWRSPIAGMVRVRGRVVDGDPNGGDGVAWSVDRRRGHGSEQLAAGAIESGGSQELANLPDLRPLDHVEVQPGDVIWLAISPRTTYAYDTTVVELEIAETATDGRTWSLARDVIADPLKTGYGNPHGDAYGNAGVWEFVDLLAGSEAAARIRGNPAWADWFAAVDAPGAAAERRARAAAAAGEIERSLLSAASEPAGSPAAKWYAELAGKSGPFRPADAPADERLSAPAQPRLAELRGEIAAIEKRLAEPVPMTHGAQEGGIPQTAYEGFHDTRIQIRGSYTRLGELVPRRFPRILAGENQPPITAGSGRLELARWLASADNPLTARVMVNRIWQHHFGEGIVRSPNNFGRLGERPTNPELLDYLADRFVRLGWSIKSLHREMLLSAAYQQSAVGDPETASQDPDNRWLGRARRWRLESEAIRDNLLAASGRLDLAMGGPTIRDIAAPRRTLYLATIRSDRTGFGTLFDAADPLLSVEARFTSTVAPQSLFLLNNDFVVGEARALADRILAEQAAVPTADPATIERARIERLYELLYARSVTDREVELARAFLAARRAVGDQRTA